MSALLNKAARAVHDVPRERGDAFDVGDTAARNIARAVLLAVRVPDGPVATAGTNRYRSQLGSDGYWDNGISRSVFSSMIDAILGEEDRP